MISFPNLGISVEISPTVFGTPIHWYGVIIALGVIFGYLYAYMEAKRLGENTENVTDLLLWALPFSVLGARTYYVIFEWDRYKDNFLDVFKIWKGGLAIYGAVIAAVIVAIIFTKKRKLPTLRYFDFAIMGVIIGQMIGRWGNFVNQEAYGTHTDLPWGMLVEGEALPVHPTFLYESLWNLVGFLILHFLRKKKPFDGSIFCGYLVWYGTGRAWIEGLRTDSLWLLEPYVRVSQLLSVILILFGILYFIYLKNKTKMQNIDN